ncbi:MAG: hypothetical protein ABI697_04020 [Devosia sp.]
MGNLLLRRNIGASGGMRKGEGWRLAAQFAMLVPIRQRGEIR